MVEAFFSEHLTQLSITPLISNSILQRLANCNSSVPNKKLRGVLKTRESVPKLPSSPSKESQRINLQDSKQRQEYYQEERKKTEATKERAKEWIREQQLRKQKLKQKHKEEMTRLLSQQEDSNKLQAEQDQRFKEKYHQHWEAIRSKKEAKIKEVEELKIRGKDYPFVSQKPMYKVIEEKYQSEVELPNLCLLYTSDAADE